MKIKRLVAAATMAATTVAGFGALPSKPDFAFPETVKQDAAKQLKAALKKKDGQATVRALLDYGLAQNAITPDDLTEVTALFDDTFAKVKDSETRAMILFAKAMFEESDSLIINTINEYDTALKSGVTAKWKGVVDADERFFPTLYDFAVAQVLDNDSIADAAYAYNADNEYPRIYIALSRAETFEQCYDVYKTFSGYDVEAYALAAMAKEADSLEERRLVYDLCKSSISSLTEITEQTIKYVVRPEINVSAPAVVGKGEPLSIKIHGECVNKATLRIEMQEPKEKLVQKIYLNFDGTGVFKVDSTVTINLDTYGVYCIKPEIDNVEHKGDITVRVSDFLLSQQRFGEFEQTMALDIVNGAKQDDVELRTVNRQISGSRGSDIYSPSLRKYSYSQSTDERFAANILTDRAIYRPGDVVYFTATLMHVEGIDRKLDTNKTSSVELINANYQVIDTLTLTSDEFGRICGEFKLPTEGLTGRFKLRITNVATTAFWVSEYKAPTFAIEANAERIDSTEVVVSGVATGYNGFPIANARVVVEVNQLPEWVWWHSYRACYKTKLATDTVETAADGSFTARFTISENEHLSATAIVTSPTGESHETYCFIPRCRYFISADIAEFTEAGTPPQISIKDASGNVVEQAVDVCLTATADSTKVVPNKDWSNVPSGVYQLTAKTADADELTRTVCVYSRNDKMPPMESALFVPITSVNDGDELLVGTSYADSHILYTLFTADKIIEQKWLTPKQGNFLINTTLPDTINSATLSLHTLRNGQFERKEISIVRQTVANKLEIEICSMRNKIVPGDTENWTIKVRDNTGQPATAAVVLDVYSKALDALAPMNWSFSRPSIYAKRLLFNERSAGTDWTNIYDYVKMPWTVEEAEHSFNLWGQYLGHMILFEPMCSTLGSAPIQYSKSASTNSEAIMEADEEATEAEEVETPNNDDYRLPDCPTAMWQPMLNTDSDGTLQLQFVAPNANTTWAVKALAYTEDLLYGTTSAEITAAKPIMVQTLVPRFLRTTDSIEIRAMVQNNSDTAAVVTSMIELFNPATEEVIETKEFCDTISGKGSTVISIAFTASSESMIGMRVRSTVGNYTDGEQLIVPILSDVVTTQSGRTIFIPAETTSAGFDVPRGGIMTINGNALRECIMALPGLQATESNSSLEAVATLFSAATARGLLRDHKEIASALEHSSEEDSAFVSRLMRNDDLKMCLLGATPWVVNAQSDTERRARLRLLFDKQLTDSTIQQATTTLAKLVRDGGLAWNADSEDASLWITLRVLDTLAQLKRIGYLPQNEQLNTLIQNAIQYVDDAVAKDFAQSKRKSTYPYYVMIRSAFSEIRQSTPIKRVCTTTVKYMLDHWRYFSFEETAYAAIILYENGYQSTAEELIESLRQHRPWNQMFVSPTLLNAFNLIAPDCAETEEIRTKYISIKQNTDWGSGVAASDLVAAILNSGKQPMADNTLNVSVNGVVIAPEGDNFLGEVRINLPEGGRVNVSKGEFPVWGGIFGTSTDAITEVEAFGSDDVKITRTIDGEMKVGNKVTLTLTIECAEDIDYVVVHQPRCAAFEPVETLPQRIGYGFISAYYEPCSTQTNWFIDRLYKGTTIIYETFYVTSKGTFLLAPAEVQSQYSPEKQAHSSGLEIKVSE